VALGVPHREDRHRETTSATVLGLDLRLIVTKSNAAGRKKGAVKRIRGSMKSAEGKKIGEQLIKSGSAWRSAAASRSVAAWMKIADGRRLASLSGWPVNGRWRTNGARMMKLARVTAGHIDRRCCVGLFRIWKICTDLSM
jgi:hypothetical protein